MKLTKEKLYILGAVVLGLGAVYLFTKSFGSIALMVASLGAGWYLKGKFGKKVEEAIDQQKG
jgi:hypothetical protein